MKKSVCFLYAGAATVLLFVTGCSQEAPESLVVATDVVPTATEAPPTEVPTPTEVPLLPCDIVFDSTRDGNREVYVMAPDGSNQTNLSNNPADDFDPVWSPDGSQIAFVSNRDNGAEGGRFVYVMQADGSDVRQVGQQNDSIFPDWSPLGDKIVYTSYGDLYLVNVSDGSEVQLTDSPEKDEQAKISRDGQQIAWVKGERDSRRLYLMNIDGSHVVQLTQAGTVHSLEWSVDGRIFAGWEHPEGLCHNCVLTTDGQEVIEAGGKGAVQEFLPFWTLDGQRVELGSGDINGAGNMDIFLVGENFPDIFLFLTDSPGEDDNPDTAFTCGPTHGVYPQYGE